MESAARGRKQYGPAPSGPARSRNRQMQFLGLLPLTRPSADLSPRGEGDKTGFPPITRPALTRSPSPQRGEGWGEGGVACGYSCDLENLPYFSESAAVAAISLAFSAADLLSAKAKFLAILPPTL